jgi:hypothetical protein
VVLDYFTARLSQPHRRNVLFIELGYVASVRSADFHIVGMRADDDTPHNGINCAFHRFSVRLSSLIILLN